MNYLQSTLSRKYQTVIPSQIRRLLQLKAGDTIIWQITQYKNQTQAIASPKPQKWTEYTRGLGKSIWKDVNIEDYIRKLRSEWQNRD